MQQTNVIEQRHPIETVAIEINPTAAPTMTLCSYGATLTRDELARLATPEATATQIRGVPVAQDLEPFQRVHVSVQGIRSHSSIQGNGKVG